MKDNLIVINKYKNLIEKYSDYGLLFPRKYFSLKDRLENLLFDNLKEMYIVNSIHDKKVRILRKEELVGRIKYLNYLFIRVQVLKVMSDKQYKGLYCEVEDIYKYLLGWLKSDRSN